MSKIAAELRDWALYDSCEHIADELVAAADELEKFHEALTKIETATDLLSAQAIARRALFETKT